MTTNPPVVILPTDKQHLLLSCPHDDILYGGARGGAKTMGSLIEWLYHQNKYGAKASGIFIRKTLVQLDAVIDEAKKLYAKIGAVWHVQAKTFEFLTGAKLKFRYLMNVADAENYQGHSYTRIYAEELTNWPVPDAIDKLHGTLRKGDTRMACKFIATANPGGVGHSWVKARYIDPAPCGMQAVESDLGARVFIPSKIDDNPHIDIEDYRKKLLKVGTPNLVKAWLDGDWDIAFGSFLQDVWDKKRHCIEPFEIPLSWERFRAMDWGYSAPYAIGWYAIDHDGIIYRYRELYGWGGEPNKGTKETADIVARKIFEIEKAERKAGCIFFNSPADSSIWNQTGTQESIYESFFNNNVHFSKADRSRGSRVSGAQVIVRLLNQDKIKIFNTCKHFIRTVPVLAVDPKNSDDVDTKAEDHCWDEFRYAMASRHRKPVKEEKKVVYKPNQMGYFLEQRARVQNGRR